MAQQNIVGGIFGITPELYQRGLVAKDTADNLTAAQLTPGQLAGYYAMEAGSGLGRATAGLLGIEDPELVKIRDVQSMRGQFDLSTPTGLRQFASALSNKGYGDLAIQASAKAADIDKEISQAQKNRTDTIKQVGLTTGGQQVYQAGNEQYILGPGGTKIPYYGKIEQKTSQTINVGLNTVDKESNNRKDFVAETKPYRDVYTTAGKIDTLLNQGPLGEIIAKKQFSKLAGDNNISNRDVEALSNFGDIGQRLAGALSQFANGVYSESQLQEAKNLVKQLKKESESSYNEIKGQYRTRLSGEKLPDKTINFIAPDLPSSKLSLQLPPGANYKEGSIVSIKGHEGKKFVIRNGKAEEQ